MQLPSFEFRPENKGSLHGPDFGYNSPSYAGDRGLATLNPLKSVFRSRNSVAVNQQNVSRSESRFRSERLVPLFAQWKAITGAFCLGILPLVIHAQSGVATAGGEYAIAGALPGDQSSPNAAVNTSGGYLVWQDNSVTKFGLRIRAEKLDANWYSIGSNFVVSAVAKSQTIGNQTTPKVALLNNGGAVFVWRGGPPNSKRIFARFLGPNGMFVTRDVSVSARPRFQQRDPQVCTLGNGNVVVVWVSDGQDGNMLGVFARLFSPAGAPLGPEFQVNQFTLNNQRSPALAPLANGNFIVAWVSELEQSASSIGIYGRMFSGSGTALTQEWAVDTTSNQICANPTVTGAANGGFAIAWSQNNNAIQPVIPIPALSIAQVNSSNPRSSDGWDVFARLFDATAAPTTDPFRLNSYTYGDQFGPSLAAAGTNYMAVWTSLSQPDPATGIIDRMEGVFGQVFNGDGSLAGTNDLHVNTAVSGGQIQPTITSDGAGRFLVTWSSVVTSGIFNMDLFAQQYVLSGGQ